MQDDSMNLNPLRVKSKTNHLVNETHPYIVERGLTSLVYDPKFDNNTRGKYIIMVDVWNFDYFWQNIVLIGSIFGFVLFTTKFLLAYFANELIHMEEQYQKEI